MIRTRWLVLAFVLALPLALVLRAPASLLVPAFSGVPLAGAPLVCGGAHGTVWDGGCRWHWRDYQGDLSWQLDAHGLMPGVAVDLSGGVQLQGWLGAGPGTVVVQGLDGRLPAALLEQMSPASAEGSLNVSSVSLRWQTERLSDVAGSLRYSGGAVSWNNGRGEATVPPLDAVLEPLADGAALVVTDDNGNLLMRGEVISNSGSLKVFRAWPQLLGVSRGGEPADVVFQTSRPLW
jgi:general secretion pathway protein N